MFFVGNNVYKMIIGVRDIIVICLFYLLFMGNEWLKIGKEGGFFY